MALGYDGSIRIDTKIDEKGFNKGVRSMTGSLSGLARAVGLAFGVAAVVLFGKSAVSAASDLASAMTGLKSVLDGMGKSFAEGKKFIDDYISDGLIPATNAITAYKNLALRGYNTDQINKTLIALKDSAAFGRQSSLTLGQAVSSATEGLKNENSILVDNAGVTKNVAKMWEDYAKSIGTTANALTKQQKIQAEVNGILQETRFQTGDAAKLTKNYAGLVASLGTSFYNLKVAVGNIIIPILSAIIPVIKRVVDGLVVITNQIAQFVAALFGIRPTVSDAAKGTDALAESTEKVEKAAKGALAAFDELNVLQPSDQPTADTPQIAVDTTPLTDSLDSTSKKFEAFVARLKEIFGPVKDALFGVVAAGMNVLGAAIDALQPGAEWLWDNFLKPLAGWAYQALLDGLGWLTDRLNDLAGWITTHQTAFQDIVIVILAFAAAWAIVNIAMGIFAAVGAAAAVVMAVLTSPVLLVVLAIGALIAIIILLYRHWDEVKVIAGKVWDGIKVIWGKAGEWLKNTVVNPIRAWFKGVWNDITTFATNAWDSVKGVWQSAREWFSSTIIEPIRSAFSTALDAIGLKWNTTFQGIVSFVKGQINTIISFLNGMLSAITGSLNSVINGLNSIHISIPGFHVPYGPSFGGYNFGLSLPPIATTQIPLLATGAVVPAHANMLAMLGEGSKREIVAPEDMIRRIVREESQQNQQGIAVRFEGSMSELIRVLRPHIERENTRVGSSLIQGAPS